MDIFVYLTAKWYTIGWPYGTFCVHLVYFFPFGMLYREKSGNPGVCVQWSIVSLNQMWFHLTDIAKLWIELILT
jgi:hypothetical protein